MICQKVLSSSSFTHVCTTSERDHKSHPVEDEVGEYHPVEDEAVGEYQKRTPKTKRKNRGEEVISVGTAKLR